MTNLIHKLLLLAVTFFSIFAGASEELHSKKTSTYREIFQTHKGNVSDKWDNYFEIYTSNVWKVGFMSQFP